MWENLFETWCKIFFLPLIDQDVVGEVTLSNFFFFFFLRAFSKSSFIFCNWTDLRFLLVYGSSPPDKGSYTTPASLEAYLPPFLPAAPLASVWAGALATLPFLSSSTLALTKSQGPASLLRLPRRSPAHISSGLKPSGCGQASQQHHRSSFLFKFLKSKV